ncbi:MAG: hypothetical protein IKA00_04280 [Prevotella sp.]|nr:hypothetical protein [Prevotella sp.]
MKTIKKMALLAVAGMVMVGCGSKNQSTAFADDSIDSTAMMLINQNRTVFGLCGDETNDSTLQLITDSGDTLLLGLQQAYEKEQVYGSFQGGDKMAVMLSDDKKGATHVICESMLQGDWVMLNPLDGSSTVGISIKEGGIAESIEQSTIFYKTWRIVNGQIEITLVREGGGDEEEINVYNIIKLDADSLIYSNEEDLMEYERRK